MGSQAPGFGPQFKYKTMGGLRQLRDTALMLGAGVENGIQGWVLQLVQETLYWAPPWSSPSNPCIWGQVGFSEPRELIRGNGIGARFFSFLFFCKTLVFKS